jgi:hypothetical protein
MRSGDKRGEDGGISGLTGQEERARRSVAGFSLDSGPRLDEQHHQQEHQGSAEAAAVQQTPGLETGCVKTVGRDLHDGHQPVTSTRKDCAQHAMQINV